MYMYVVASRGGTPQMYNVSPNMACYAGCDNTLGACGVSCYFMSVLHQYSHFKFSQMFENASIKSINVGRSNKYQENMS